ncbi:hypothetical protein QUB68_12210 [Microcoleus sp. A006_D1]|uniref:hypothetical protein n=1 Tax=Microcoleus sp. A006_D1 TaxID=3055267 RepID=UPI002FD22DAC
MRERIIANKFDCYFLELGSCHPNSGNTGGDSSNKGSYETTTRGSRNRSLPILDITGNQVQRWMNFVQKFRPDYQLIGVILPDKI